MTRDQKTYRFAHWLASFIIAGVLLSGYHKLIYPDEFAVSVYRFHILPGFLVNPVALYFPWLELTCAVCLLANPRYRLAALWIVLVLLVLFTAAIGFNLWQGSTFGCGCFGRAVLDRPMSGLSILRNVGLILLVTLALVAGKRT